MDAACWKWLRNYVASQPDYCLASHARKLCVTYIVPIGISSVLACQLFSLINKCPRIHPTDVGEISCCIISKAFSTDIKPDIVDVAGCLQLCASKTLVVSLQSIVLKDV